MTKYVIMYKYRRGKKARRIVDVNDLAPADHWIYLYGNDQFGMPWTEVINAHTVSSIVRLEDVRDET